MSKNPNDTYIGDAWAAHRQGRNSEAISSFESIIASASDDVDAYYGLGLAQRANRQYPLAMESFSKALSLAETKLAAIRGEAGQENVLTTTGDDRYMMMLRMISQRIEEVKRLSR